MLVLDKEQLFLSALDKNLWPVVFFIVFMCSGPNGHGVPNWPEYFVDRRRYLELRGPGDYVVIETFREKYCQIWREINQQVQRQAEFDRRDESFWDRSRRR